MNLYEKAKRLSQEAHESIGQKRKHNNRPYYTHPLEVAALLETVTNDEEVLVAACLHDILEDVTPINPFYGKDWILREFGSKVLYIVVELTNVYTANDYPQYSRRVRKTLERERLSKVSDAAKMVKRADLHHNDSEMDEEDSFTPVWRSEKNELEGVLGGNFTLLLSSPQLGGRGGHPSESGESK
jgi:(p)ppGpp synthase/HD superfamily hydrolase